MEKLKKEKIPQWMEVAICRNSSRDSWDVTAHVPRTRRHTECPDCECTTEYVKLHEGRVSLERAWEIANAYVPHKPMRVTVQVHDSHAHKLGTRVPPGGKAELYRVSVIRAHGRGRYPEGWYVEAQYRKGSYDSDVIVRFPGGHQVSTKPHEALALAQTYAREKQYNGTIRVRGVLTAW